MEVSHILFIFTSYSLAYKFYVDPMSSSNFAAGTIDLPFKSLAGAMYEIFNFLTGNNTQTVELNLKSGAEHWVVYKDEPLFILGLLNFTI